MLCLNHGELRIYLSLAIYLEEINREKWIKKEKIINEEIDILSDSYRI